MRPVKFKEVNKLLEKPSSMADKECFYLSVFTDGERCISKWKMSWMERFHCLFRGYVWLGVRSGKTQPPVYLLAKKTIFKD